MTKSFFFSATSKMNVTQASVMVNVERNLQKFYPLLQAKVWCVKSDFASKFEAFLTQTSDTFCPSVQCWFNTKIGDILPVNSKPFLPRTSTLLSTFDGWNLPKKIWRKYPNVQCWFNTKIGDILPRTSDTFVHFWRLEFSNKYGEILAKCSVLIWQENWRHFCHELRTRLSTFDGWNLPTNMEKYCPSVQCWCNTRIGEIFATKLRYILPTFDGWNFLMNPEKCRTSVQV